MTDDWASLDAKLEKLGRTADIIEKDVAPQICQVMREYAGWALRAQVYSRPEGWYKRARNLEQSVIGAQNIVERDGDTMVSIGIETSAEYAKYIEYGTGPNGSAEYDGHVSEGVTFSNRKSWLFVDDDGEVRIAKSQKARPFMRPALYDNVDVFKEEIAKGLTGIFS